MKRFTFWLLIIAASLNPGTVYVHAQPQPVLFAQSAKNLSRQMNEFCVVMHKTYSGMNDFADGYREAYELLQIAKKIDLELSYGSTPDSVREQLTEFDNEIHHVEHHLSEFAKLQGPSGKVAQETVTKSFHEVESTLSVMINELGIRRKKPSEHADETKSSESALADFDFARASVSSKELARRMNEFCVVMHKTYHGVTEFDEAYREAYDLLGLSKQIDEAISSKAVVQSIIDQVTEFDSEIHHTEHHLTELATAQGASDNAAQDAVTKSFEEVESTLNVLMNLLGIKKKGKEGHDDGTSSKAGAIEVPVSELAKKLSTEIGSFCSAMSHNYKNNPEFPEAYKEAYSLFESSKKMCELTKDNELGDECKELISEFDEEMHHLEEHVNGFKADDKGGSRRISRKLNDVEKALHALMANAGLKRGHTH